MLLAVAVTAASVDDARGAREALASVDSDGFPRLRVVWADSKYHNYELYRWVAEHADYELQIVSRPAGAKGFVLLPKRWVAERTFAWLGRARRLSKDYEKLIDERSNDYDQRDSYDGRTVTVNTQPTGLRLRYCQ
jgi:putative transposase